MKLGNNSFMNAKVVEKDGFIVMGNNSYVNGGMLRAERGNIIIGNGCRISYNVFMVTSYQSHIVDGSREDIDIIIGNNVWIGYGAMIRGGVTIGNNSIVAMGSVVLDDVPENSMVAGNPAVIKKENGDWKVI